MTISDLLGNPLPSTLVAAKSMEEIEISWRKWLGMRVKIIDEYNRIPTRTQSALLTVLADNYAQILDHVYECPDAAWFLTANDDAGGGTYQVIEALRDRIDIVVKALHFNTRFLGDLLLRIEQGIKPEEVIPQFAVRQRSHGSLLVRLRSLDQREAIAAVLRTLFGEQQRIEVEPIGAEEWKVVTYRHDQ